MLLDRQDVGKKTLCAGWKGMDAQNSQYVKYLWMVCADGHFCSMNAYQLETRQRTTILLSAVWWDC